ncbi:MAG: DUF3575 domain-containing protein [Prevotellaceae bacterium]|nr:DUF3575 domain-containing protein [Prevotellaceae bacterium]
MQLLNCNKVFFAAFIICIISVFEIAAQDLTPPVNPRGHKLFYFPINRTELLYDYSNNAAMLAALDALLADTTINSQIDTVYVIGAASPKGSHSYNERLAKGRTAALKEYITSCPNIEESRIVCNAIGVDWVGFRSLVASDQDIPNRHILLELLIQHLSEDRLLYHLTYKMDIEMLDYLVERIYSKLQYTSVRVLLKDGRMIPETSSPFEEPETKVEKIIHDTVVVHDTVCIIKKDTVPEKKFAILLKNNLLYDVALLPNLAVEIPFGDRWSALVGGYWSWWDTDAPRWWSYRIQWVWLEARRWWIKPDATPLDGWFTGLYVAGGDYDIRLFTETLDDLGYLSLWSMSAGLTGGYSLPLSQRLNMEFLLGVGWFGGNYKAYNRSRCLDCYPYMGKGRFNYWGLTSAAISIVYLIGKK